MQELQRAVPFAKGVSTPSCIDQGLYTSGPVIRKQPYIGQMRKEGKVPDNGKGPVQGSSGHIFQRQIRKKGEDIRLCVIYSYSSPDETKKNDEESVKCNQEPDGS